MGDQIAFYSTAASLIPVLLLTGVIEYQRVTRTFMDSPDASPASVVWLTIAAIVGFFVVAVWGEFAALDAVLHGPDDGNANVVTNTLIGMTAFLLGAALSPALVTLEQKGVNHASTIGFTLVVLCAVVAILLKPFA